MSSCPKTESRYDKSMSFHKGLDIITRFWKEKKNNSDIDLRNSQHSSQSALTQITSMKYNSWKVWMSYGFIITK